MLEESYVNGKEQAVTQRINADIHSPRIKDIFR